MRSVLVALLLSVGLVSLVPGTSDPWSLDRAPEVPTMNLPVSLRVRNHLGPMRQGSCVHVSWVMLLRWQNRPDLADYWYRKYGDGEYYDRMAARLNAEGIRWAGTESHEVAFLEWAVRTRRGCMVTVDRGAHMVILVHLDRDKAGILDNNDPGRIKWVTRQSFLSEWAGWAMTPIYTPAPPL